VYWRRPLSRLELALYCSIIAILIAVFLDRGLYYMELAERTAVNLTVRNVASAINVRIAHGLLRGESTPASRLIQRNPFELAGATPPNYAGTSGLDEGAVEAGTWAYDPQRGVLLYRPRVSRGLRVEDGGSLLRFRLEPADTGPGVLLVPAIPYTWQ
jgi:hypothetical protein